jgi:uncharacterized membrane protein YgdD (TMEM256/DUF423 family)
MIYNGLALLAISFHPGLNSGLKRYKAAPIMIASGAALFSGTIFGLVLSIHNARRIYLSDQSCTRTCHFPSTF